MSDSKPHIRDGLRELLADEKPERFHPEPEALVDFRLGRLDERDAERVERHLVRCDECRASFLDLVAADPEAQTQDEGPETGDERELIWRRVAATLEADPEHGSAPVQVGSVRRHRSRPIARWLVPLAAVLALAVVGMGAWNLSLRQGRDPAPRLEAAVRVAPGLPRGAVLPADAAGGELSLMLAPPLDGAGGPLLPAGRYRVVIRGGGEELWRSPAERWDGARPLALTVDPRRHLVPGENLIELVADGSGEVVAQYVVSRDD